MFSSTTVKSLGILDFDIENRPLSYLGQDYTTGEVTAIAWSWVGEDDVHCEVLTPEIEKSTRQMLSGFLYEYDQAAIVTGHYIRKHDLPILSGAMLEYGFNFGPKLSSDTKMDLIKAKYLSASQESLAGMFELPTHKHHMSTPEWRKANRLTPEGIEATKKRVIDDVIQHKALRERLVSVGALKPPKLWSP